MPNWAEGTLKIRGRKSNIKKFLIEGLQPLEAQGAVIARLVQGEDVNKAEPIVAEIEEDQYEITLKNPEKEGLHLKGSRRNFIDSNYINIYWHDEDENEDKDKEQVVVIDEFKAAWAIDEQAIIKLAQAFNIDIRIYVFECGMEYNHEFEVDRTGLVILNKEIKFDDYEWECPMPKLGG